MAAQVRPSVAAAVSNFKCIVYVEALSHANRGVSWAFLFYHDNSMVSLLLFFTWLVHIFSLLLLVCY